MTKQTQKEQTAAESAVDVDQSDIKEALNKIRTEEVPATPEEKEVYFMAQVQAGDQFVQRGQSLCSVSVSLPPHRLSVQVLCST